jgi:hypothetical protein
MMMVCLGNTRTCLGNSWWYQSPPEWGGGFVVAGHVTVPEPSRALEQEKSYPIHGCSGAPPRRGEVPGAMEYVAVCCCIPCFQS